MRPVIRSLLLALSLAVTTCSFPPRVFAGQANQEDGIAEKSTHRIVLDLGGGVVDYILKYDAWRQDGDRVAIDGPCISACTLIVGLMPNESVCVTPRAIFGFHSAYNRTGYDREWTRLIWRIYPRQIREMLWERNLEGPIEHDHLVYLSEFDLRIIYRECDPEDLSNAVPVVASVNGGVLQ